MIDYYESVPIEEYECILANREYWDNVSAEWERLSKMETKLVRLGIFVQRGGDLNCVIARYAEGREHTYRVMIQHCIERYIEALTLKQIPDWELRLYKLEKEEAVELLAELLKAGVKRLCDTEGYTKEWHAYGEVDWKHLDGDSILVAVEHKHQECHPNESIEDAMKRVRKWIWDSLW